MNKIISIKEVGALSKKLKHEGKTIVLAGGCFDVLHLGHVLFLKKAKEQGDVLFVLLESDLRIKTLKGKTRPINPQKTRALVLSSLSPVSYVVALPQFTKDKDYDNLINLIKPDIIAATKKDPNISHKQRQAKMVGGKVTEVIERIPEHSTSKLSQEILK